MYRAKFAFEGQEGEMSLKKDELYELIEKDDNGWWLVKKDGVEGWAPSNYLELVPPKPKAAPAPPPPPPAGRRVPPAAPAAPISSTASAGHATPRTFPKPVTADPSAKPVAVFPGMMPSNGSAAPWKKTASTGTNGSSRETTPTSSRPTSSLASKAPPPAPKPKPGPPPLAAKPGMAAPPKVGAKPPVPAASRPPAAAPKPRSGGVSKPAAPAGQLDLAAVVSFRGPVSTVLLWLTEWADGRARTETGRWAVTNGRNTQCEDETSLVTVLRSKVL